MGYHTRCTSCYGTKEVWAKSAPGCEGFTTKPCPKCAGTGHVKGYRRALNLTEGAALGWNDMDSSPQYRDDKCCVSCNQPLTGRKRSFCGNDCRSGYVWRVWRGAHWQKRAVANRDGAACRSCGEVFESPIRDGGKPYPDYTSLELDHVKPLHLGGTESPANCQLLCAKCHRAKTARERRRAV